MRFNVSIQLLSIFLITSIFFSALAAFSNNQENQAPVVKIILPANGGKFQWNSIIQYKISVNDSEDGNSEYDEIPSNEVILKVTYLPDSSSARKYLAEEARLKSDPPGLALIKISICFTCHLSKDKLIGPSFDRIANRYKRGATTIESLAQKVIKGSNGVWGNTAMPANPELKMESAKKMVSWILENNINPDTYFLTGIVGAFKTKERPLKGGESGMYVLTASYEDHGINGLPQTKKRGQHSIVLVQ